MPKPPRRAKSTPNHSDRSPDPSSAPPIDRSAAKSAKGPRLQRLRASLFLVEAFAHDSDTVQAYVAVEADGDVFAAVATKHSSSAYSEEDKNYDAEATFTFASPSVLNSVVIFADQWISWDYSNKLRFGLYATSRIGKEKESGRIKELNVTLPAQPVIELLRLNDFSDTSLLSCVKALIIDEYRTQYNKHSSRGRIDIISMWSDGTWMLFLSRINWLLASGDESECEEEVTKAIKKCRGYRQCHEGKEDIILGALLDLLDKKQLANDFAERFVHVSELELLFLRIESGEIKRTDPTWKQWERLPPPVDQRNVGEKFLAVCPTLNQPTLGRLQRRTAAGLLELDAQAQDKTVLALRYQIFDACDNALQDLARRSQVMTEQELMRELDQLVQVAMERVNQRSPDFHYALTNEASIRGVVLTLFDSCFLSLDGARNGH